MYDSLCGSTVQTYVPGGKTAHADPLLTRFLPYLAKADVWRVLRVGCECGAGICLLTPSQRLKIGRGYAATILFISHTLLTLRASTLGRVMHNNICLATFVVVLVTPL